MLCLLKSINKSECSLCFISQFWFNLHYVTTLPVCPLWPVQLLELWLLVKLIIYDASNWLKAFVRRKTPAPIYSTWIGHKGVVLIKPMSTLSEGQPTSVSGPDTDCEMQREFFIFIILTSCLLAKLNIDVL